MYLSIYLQQGLASYPGRWAYLEMCSQPLHYYQIQTAEWGSNVYDNCLPISRLLKFKHPSRFSVRKYKVYIYTYMYIWTSGIFYVFIESITFKFKKE